MKNIATVLLVLAMIVAVSPAAASETTAQSPTMSMTMTNLNHVVETTVNTSLSPTLSMTITNLNQVTGTSTSPTMSMTLNNLNQVNNTKLSPNLSMALNNLNRFSIIGEYGVSLVGLLTIMDSLTDDARAAFEAIAAYVAKGQAAAGYFGMDLAELVLSGSLSSSYSGFDFSSLILSEYVSLGIYDFEASDYGVSTVFGFASEYRDGQTVVAMFGYLDAKGDIVWNALNTTAVDGQVRVDIPSELLLLAGSEAILGILS